MKNTNLDKSIDSNDGHVWLRFGIIHQIQVDKFFQFQIIRLHTIGHIRKKGRNIFTNCHRSNNLQKKIKKIDVCKN